MRRVARRDVAGRVGWRFRAERRAGRRLEMGRMGWVLVGRGKKSWWQMGTSGAVLGDGEGRSGKEREGWRGFMGWIVSGW